MSGFRVTAVIPPLGDRTSLIYHSGGHIRRPVDGGGRVTSFTVNSSGDRAIVTTPELCQTGFPLLGPPARYNHARIDRSYPPRVIWPLPQGAARTFGTVYID